MELKYKFSFIIYSVCLALLVGQTFGENATLDRLETRTAKLMTNGGHSNGQSHGLNHVPSTSVVSPPEHSPHGCGTVLTFRNQQIVPWSALVYNVEDRNHKCDGTLITPRTVLSLEKCFRGLRTWKKNHMRFEVEFAHPVKKMITIPVQAKNSVELNYKLAVFILAKPVKDPYVMPVCFPPDNFDISETSSYFVSSFGVATSSNDLKIHTVTERAAKGSFEPLNVFPIKEDKKVPIGPGAPLLVEYEGQYVQLGVMSNTRSGTMYFINLLYSSVHEWMVTDEDVKVLVL